MFLKSSLDKLEDEDSIVNSSVFLHCAFGERCTLFFRSAGIAEKEFIFFLYHSQIEKQKGLLLECYLKKKNYAKWNRICFVMQSD